MNRPFKRTSWAWVLFAARRYVSSRRRDKSSPSSALAILGIATGVLALTVILAVMNGFQLGFIETILELSSYHLRVEVPQRDNTSSLLKEIRSLPSVASVVPFVEIQGIVRGQRRNQQGCLVRAFPQDALRVDPRMAKKLVFEAGAFNLSSPHGILIGAELARTLGLRLGDPVSFLSLTGTSLTVNVPENVGYTVEGIFRTGFYEYDSSWAFINLDKALALLGSDSPVTLGVKLKNQWNDGNALAELRSIPELRSAHIVSWREYNRAFFGALRMEKLLMFFLVALIFVVVALNIYQAQRRNVLERRDEIALLRAVGASETAVRLVFVLDGLIIGIMGALGGLLPALWIAFHIGQFFSTLERIVNGTLGILDLLIRPFVGAGATEGDFRVFSPAVFYIKEIPSRVIPLEVFVVFLFGVLSATLAAWLASGKTARIRPAEVLRDE